MVRRLTGYRFAQPRRRRLSRGAAVAFSPCSAVEILEERTLLSASLAIYNGSYAGTYQGVETTHDKGVVTKTTVTPTAFQATITDGVITLTVPNGTGTGTVNSNGQISGTVTTTSSGENIVTTFTGTVTAANDTNTRVAGSWSYSTNLGNGVTVSGHGTWSGLAAAVVTDFDGNYVGSYQGTAVVNNNGTKTTTTVSPTTFEALISSGTITDSFASDSGLSSGTGTIGANGNISGTVSGLIDGVTVTVTDTGHAARSLTGVEGHGTWVFSVNFGGGVTETGRGTWTFQSVLIADGAYSGSFTGSTVLNDNGVITTTPVADEVSDLSVSLTISNGAVTVSAPGVPATGTGTIDQNGDITGSMSFTVNGVTVTGQFAGTVVLTPAGNVITGTWSFSVDLGNGSSETGSGTWTAQS